MRQAYIDRNQLLGDVRFVKNPVDLMLSKAYAARIRSGIDPQRAGNSGKLAAGAGFREGQHTTHYSIADRFGNAVSVTYTLNDWFGARVTAAGTGMLLNNEMDDFTSKVGVPNLYGLVQGENNKIEPGKRPLSSMSPTIVLKQDKPWIIVGTPGGSRIITAVTLTLLNVIDYGMNLQEAVDAPRIHQQWLPEQTFVEDRALSPDTRAILAGMGHKLTVPQPENHVAAILIEGGTFQGAIDPRRNTGLALGY
jgi:gamma-glutamyltranspeptidase/glutathione hydrolase